MTVWYRLKDKLPEGNGPFLYFPVYACCGHSIQTSNGEFLRGPYANREEILWAEIDKPEGYEEFESKRWEWDN